MQTACQNAAPIFPPLQYLIVSQEQHSQPSKPTKDIPSHRDNHGLLRNELERGATVDTPWAKDTFEIGKVLTEPNGETDCDGGNCATRNVGQVRMGSSYQTSLAQPGSGMRWTWCAWADSRWCHAPLRLLNGRGRIRKEGGAACIKEKRLVCAKDTHQRPTQ